MTTPSSVTREKLLHQLYEAAELEHNLMCTYLYAAFSLKSGEEEGLTAAEAAATARWRRAILDVAIDEMAHLVMVWNISLALGGAPRFGRGNFPLDAGYLPAGVTVKLAPFGADVLQHFVHLERPADSSEPEGRGFEPEISFSRGERGGFLTPMGVDYDTVGAFYEMLETSLREFVARVGEDAAFCGSPDLQLTAEETGLDGVRTVICLKTALGALDAIVAQGEGAKAASGTSHFDIFLAVREEYGALLAANAAFAPAFPAARNPVLRPPPRPEGRVWIEDAEAIATVDLANACYGLMLRLLAYAFEVPRGVSDKGLAIDLAIGLMKAMALLGERAARLPAGPSHPECHAGMSFTALRDAAGLPPGASARNFFIERFGELSAAGETLAQGGDARVASASRALQALATRANAQFVGEIAKPAAPAPSAASAAPATSEIRDGVEIVEGEKMTLMFEAKRCIHTRYCVTGAPNVFLANVQGPWIHPDAMDVEELAGIARECPSGAIRYRRKDGAPDEAAPLVNLVRIMEGGPYAVRANIHLDGAPIGTRATLCRCGHSKNKPYCDGSHHDVHFDATGEPPTGDNTAMLTTRDGVLEVTPQKDGPLVVRGNLEVMAGTGRVVARVMACRLCRCGGSQNKPFCDGTHAKIGFKSDPE